MRYNDAKYLAYIRSQPCIVCGFDGGCHPHHILSGSGKRNNDYFTVPLCSYHHTGDEGIHTVGAKTFAQKTGVEFYSAAAALLVGYLRGRYGKERAVKAIINEVVID